MNWRFFVSGIPAPKGSTRAFFVAKLGRAIITSANAKTKPWEQAVRAEAANAAAGAPPTVAPIEVHVVFRFPRPKGHFRANGQVSPKAPLRLTKKPDLDKLERALLDALTGLLFVDDSQVVSITSMKRYTKSDEGEEPGAAVAISVVAEEVAA